MAALSGKSHMDRLIETPDTEAAAIAASWRRCLEQHGMDPERDDAIRVVSRRELQEARDPIDHIVSIADRVLDDLYRRVAGDGYAVILTDAGGIALTSRVADNENGFRRWGLADGAVWSEASEGTNGVGLCLAEQRAITIHHQEHFRSRYAGLTCTAAPIFDAYGQLAGGLDVSSCDTDVDRRVIAFARAATFQAARDIEEACFRHAYRRNWIVALGRSDAGDMLLAFDDGRRLVGANRNARATLGVDEALIAKGIEVLEADFRDFPLLTPNALIVEGDRASLRIARSTPFTPPAERPVSRPVVARQARVPAIASLAGGDSRLQEGMRRIAATAALDLPLLILGETGTGKETFARAIHESILGADKPFVVIDCGALSEASIDRDVFGTPAARSDDSGEGAFGGRIGQAAGGTLFLAEVADLPLALQSRFLRIIETRRAPAPGGDATDAAPIRIACATQHDLEAMVAAGTFRADLYHRLRGVALRLPPLREREDRRDLVTAILITIDPRARLSKDAARTIEAHAWPGNLRELHRTLRVAAAVCRDHGIEVGDLDLPPPPETAGMPRPQALEASIGSAERAVIVAQLAADDFDVAKAAKALGLSRSTLYRRMKRLGI